MRKKIGNKGNTSERIFVASLFAIILLAFVLLVPKVASTIFSQRREMILNNFLTSTKNKQKINTQEFWKFREFYSPGYFLFDSRGLKKTDTDATLQRLNIPLRNNVIKMSFHIFYLPYLISLDSLTTKKRVQDIIDTKKLSQHNIIYQNNTTYIYKSDSTIIIIFLASAKEMEKANGFFDYQERDKDIIANEYWLDITQVNRN